MSTETGKVIIWKSANEYNKPWRCVGRFATIRRAETILKPQRLVDKTRLLKVVRYHGYEINKYGAYCYLKQMTDFLDFRFKSVKSYGDFKRLTWVQITDELNKIPH